MASSTDPISHSKRLVHILYKDHIEFRNTSRKLYFDVNVRETVGWLTQEEDDFVVLTSDRSVDPLPYEIRENFLILIKSDILEMKEVK